MKHPSGLHRLAAALSISLASLLVLGGAASAQERTDAPERYARVQARDARIRNLADDRGIELAKPEAGSALAVYREVADWLEVEVPGGLAVWVHGRYVQPTDEEDVFEVTRNAVNMRPQPKSEVTNFPLPQRLHAGDRVRVIEYRDAGVPLENNWVRIWSPPGVRAWIRSSETAALADGEDGAAIWQAALRDLAATPGRSAPPTPRPVEAVAAKPTQEPEARQALLSARALMVAERKKEKPDFGAVRTAIEAVLELAPTGPVAIEARQELERVAFHEEAAAVRAGLEIERARLAEEARMRQQDVIERSRRKDPLGDVFLSRGTLIRRVAPDGMARYYLRFGGELASELFCASGRYELEAFAGCQIGVHGAKVPAATGDPTDAGGPELRIEIERLEVIVAR